MKPPHEDFLFTLKADVTYASPPPFVLEK